MFQVTDFLQLPNGEVGITESTFKFHRRQIKINFVNVIPLSCAWFHVYKDEWSPLIGDELVEWKYEEGNEHDEYALAVYLNDQVNEKICHFIFPSQFLSS